MRQIRAVLARIGAGAGVESGSQGHGRGAFSLLRALSLGDALQSVCSAPQPCNAPAPAAPILTACAAASGALELGPRDAATSSTLRRVEGVRSPNTLHTSQGLPAQNWQGLLPRPAFLDCSHRSSQRRLQELRSRNGGWQEPPGAAGRLQLLHAQADAPVHHRHSSWQGVRPGEWSGHAKHSLASVARMQVSSLGGTKCKPLQLAPSARLVSRGAASAATSPRHGQGQGQGQRRSAMQQMRPDGVKHIVAVASGKGGVGKSTTAVNLAASLAHHCGLRVGLLDADVYGPSLPRLLNLHGRPQILPGPGGAQRMVGLQAYGITCMSMGFLMDEDAAAVWRGPMVTSALEHMLFGTLWGPLDILVMDMPPGTGDAQLTVAQKAALSGAVIVSTPQDLALLDARRGAIMFRKVNIPILGLIENMSYFICPSCGERTDIFSHGGGRDTAQQMDMDFLGEIPLQTRIRQLSDLGRPVCIADPSSEVTLAYNAIAERLWAKISLPGQEAGHGDLPKIVME